MNRPIPSLFLATVLLIALFILSPLYEQGRRLHQDSAALSTVAGSLENRNTNAFARILGELRIGAADFLFVKTELYLHGGIGYAEHTDDLESMDAVLEGSSPEAEVHADHTAHDHHGPEHAHGEEAPGAAHAEEGVQTRIRNADEDFRGIVGALEREIKPWRDPNSPHVLTEGSELLPWFRLMTIANPHFVRGYRIGALWLGRENKYVEALEFLDEGIANNQENPELFQLYLSRVTALAHLARENEVGIDEDALAAVQRGLELGYEFRPKGGETGKIRNRLLWTEDHEEDLLFLTRFEVNILSRLGRTEEALEAVGRHRGAFPEDGVLERIELRLQDETTAPSATL
jgi:hypothetical protein